MKTPTSNTVTIPNADKRGEPTFTANCAGHISNHSYLLRKIYNISSKNILDWNKYSPLKHENQILQIHLQKMLKDFNFKINLNKFNSQSPTASGWPILLPPIRAPVHPRTKGGGALRLNPECCSRIFASLSSRSGLTGTWLILLMTECFRTGVFNPGHKMLSLPVQSKSMQKKIIPVTLNIPDPRGLPLFKLISWARPTRFARPRLRPALLTPVTPPHRLSWLTEDWI